MISSITDELSSLRVFVQVVESGSLSATARARHIAVSSIARQVKALEDSLGTRLLNKTTRRQSLTEAGRMFYDRAKLIIDTYDRAKRDVASFQDAAKGVIRVYLRTSVASAVIVPALPQFLAENPQVTLDLTLGDEHINLLKLHIDVAVFLGNLNDSSMIARRLSPSRRVVCGSPEYFKRHGIPKVPTDLSAHNCLIYRADRYSEHWHFSSATEKINVPIRGNLITSSAAALLAASLAGLGIMVAQKWMVAGALNSGQLTQVLPSYTVSPTDDDTALYAVYPHGRGLAPKERAFIDFLIRLFKSTSSTLDDY
jgi:DNA-binding transcriptional LysR family regulator